VNAFKRNMIINGGFALALTILVSLGWMNYRHMTATAKLERWEHHTYAASREFNDLLLALGDLETGERGFIITGKEQFLGPYREATGRMGQILARLQGLAQGDTRHNNPLGGIEPLIREKLALAGKTIELRKTAGFQAAYQVVMAERGRDLMDEIRRRVAEALAEEERLLESLRIREAESLEKTHLTFIAGSIASLSLLLMVFLLLRREIAQHAKAEEELLRHRDHLEELVQERTALLEEAKLAAEEASHAKGEFLANMSHEMRTPLTRIMGIIDLMLADGLADEQCHNLKLARTSADSLKHLINDTLDFSRIASGQMNFRMQPFDLRSCINSFAEIFSQQAELKGLCFLLAIDDQVPRHVVGDEGRLRQVLMNLVGNAVKFTEQGEIEVSIRPAPGPVRPEQVVLLFIIRDTGIGIPAEYMARVFEMFSQADTASTKKFSGTGLGLALSKQIVENLGGKILVESRPGKGSVFSVTIPFGADQQEEADMEHPQPAREATSILVVEDDRVTLDVIKLMIAKKFPDVAVYSADRARTGIELFKKHAPEIVVTDISMPEMDGIEMAREIKAINADTKFIVLTAFGDEIHVNKFREIGFHDFFPKPIEFAKLYVAIEKCLAELAHDQAEA